jgi:cell division protein FtsX
VKGGPRALVVSEDLARHVWPNENPVGKVLMRGIRSDTAYVVVGMAAAVRRPEGPAPTFYGAREQRADSALDGRGFVRDGEDYVNTFNTTLLIRMDRPAGPMAPAVRAAVAEIDKGITITSIRTLAERRANQLDEMLLLAYAAFGAAAVLLTLSSVGIYAIVAHGVAQRTREIGVRIALGARSHQVIALFVKQGVLLSVIGLAIGLPISIFGIRFLPSEIGDLKSNPLAFGGTALVLIGVAAFAAWLPARKAARVDPVITLRSE